MGSCLGKSFFCFTYPNRNTTDTFKMNNLNMGDLENSTHFKFRKLDRDFLIQNYKRIVLDLIKRNKKLKKFTQSNISQRIKELKANLKNNSGKKKQTVEACTSTSLNSSFASISHNQKSNKFENSEDAFWNDETYEFDQFNSPHLYLIEDSNSSLNQIKLDQYLHINTMDHKINCNSKRLFYLHQINQINVDGFEWDLI
jgi:hypothetical protein